MKRSRRWHGRRAPILNSRGNALGRLSGAGALTSWCTILEVISSPQPDPQRPNLAAPKVKEQHQHDTNGHAGEIESATGVEMMHISQSLVPLLLHIVRRCSVFPVIPVANAGGAIKKAPACLKDGA
jgi:hypothetical protein